MRGSGTSMPTEYPTYMHDHTGIKITFEDNGATGHCCETVQWSQGVRWPLLRLCGDCFEPDERWPGFFLVATRAKLGVVDSVTCSSLFATVQLTLLRLILLMFSIPGKVIAKDRYRRIHLTALDLTLVLTRATFGSWENVNKISLSLGNVPSSPGDRES